MLNIASLESLAAIIQLPPEDIVSPLTRIRSCCRHYLVSDPDRPDKDPREIFDPHRDLRVLQNALYTKLLLPNIDRFAQSHGGVKGCSQLSHVSQHIGQTFVYTIDIEKFFPSIHFTRVHKLFVAQGCSDEIARVLTRACTYNHHLAQGFITSPIIADMIIRPIDDRILRLADQSKLKYSRFVDDITLSAKFDIKQTGIPRTITGILHANGFRLSKKKTTNGRLSDATPVLNLRLNKPHPDVTIAYYQETVRRLQDHASLGAGGEFRGPFFMPDQLYGRLRYVIWINRNRRRMLLPLWRALDWGKVFKEAWRRKILAHRKRFVFTRV